MAKCAMAKKYSPERLLPSTISTSGTRYVTDHKILTHYSDARDTSCRHVAGPHFRYIFHVNTSHTIPGPTFEIGEKKLYVKGVPCFDASLLRQKSSQALEVGGTCAFYDRTSAIACQITMCTLQPLCDYLIWK